MSPTTETTLAPLPAITNHHWELRCESLAQKQQLFAYAQSKGIDTEPECYDNRNLAVGMGKYLKRLFTWPHAAPIEERQVTPDQFRAMCDDYAATR
jgi:hypothetical protein